MELPASTPISQSYSPEHVALNLWVGSAGTWWVLHGQAVVTIRLQGWGGWGRDKSHMTWVWGGSGPTFGPQEGWGSHRARSLRCPWPCSLTLPRPLWSEAEAHTDVGTHTVQAHGNIPRVCVHNPIWHHSLSSFFQEKNIWSLPYSSLRGEALVFYSSHLASWINMKCILEQLCKERCIFSTFTT